MTQTAEQLIRKLIEAMGGEETAVAIQSIHAIANCTSPHGNYTTEIRSARGQRLHFEQTWPGNPPFRAIINGEYAWGADPQTGDLRRLAKASIAMLRGHEFQMMPLTLPERFDQMAVGTAASFAGKQCATIQAIDELEKPCTLYFDLTTGLMAGFVIVNPNGEAGETVQTVFNEWQMVDGIQLPRKVTATDSSGDFVLDFHTITLNKVDGTLFTVPEAIAAGE
ncbi:hypothetical protein [Candidatus Leptofilum sp.]|uniref:hypothetical protein n=1 Tax=Candidatus Leptofilum sp. TaxID=3241576 RepID=UPI003B5C9CA5